MAKITRKEQKIFGSAAGALEIGQFGSLAAGSIAYSTDPDTIQALSQYDGGWFDAVVGSNSPAIEDMNALQYLYAYQLAYLFQAGIAEYNAATSYYIGSLVTDGSGVVYMSLTNDNTGNALTDNTNWFTPPTNGMVTPNTLPGTAYTLAANQTFTHANLTVGNGQSITVPTDAHLVVISNLTISGTGTVTATGTGTIRVL